VTGLKSESLPGFIPESCPASFRNADRDDFGIVPALPRNPQAAARLGQENININYAYCGIEPSTNAPLVILGATEAGKVAKILHQVAVAAKGT
jgi:hypothetical protein